jgi:hypothetical protein
VWASERALRTFFFPFTLKGELELEGATRPTKGGDRAQSHFKHII